jgi:hypothetical protein
VVFSVMMGRLMILIAHELSVDERLLSQPRRLSS